MALFDQVRVAAAAREDLDRHNYIAFLREYAKLSRILETLSQDLIARGIRRLWF